MSERTLRPGNVVAAALLIAGVVILALPRHAGSVLQILLVSAAVSVALYALALAVPRTGWVSPFRYLSPFGEAAGPAPLTHRSGELHFLRRSLGGRRQRLVEGPPLPPSILRRLRRMASVTLDVDPDDPEALEAVRPAVSGATYGVLATEPLGRTSWLRTRRGDARAVAAAVERVLDDLDRITERRPDPRASTDLIQVSQP